MKKMQQHLAVLEKKTIELQKELNKLEYSGSAVGTSMDHVGGSARGAGTAFGTTALAAGRLSQQFMSMDKTLKSIDKTLKKQSTQLDENTDAFERGSGAVKGFAFSVFNAHKKVIDFDKGIRDLTRDVNALFAMMNRGQSIVGGFVDTWRVLEKVGGRSRGAGGVLSGLVIALGDYATRSNMFLNNFRDNVDSIDKLNKRFVGKLLGLRSATTLFMGGWVLLWNKFRGVETVFSASPRWMRNLLLMTRGLGEFGTRMTGVARQVSVFSRVLRAFIGTAAFDGIVKGADRTGTSLRNFSKIIEKTFGTGAAYKYFKTFRPLIEGLESGDKGLTKFFRNASNGSRAFSMSMTKNSSKLIDFAKASKYTVINMASVIHNLKSLKNRFEWFFRLPKWAMSSLGIFIARILPSALKGLGNILKGTSNAIAGLWDGLKQLSGGLLVIPGLIANIGAAVTSLIPVFAGLKDQFKDIFSDDPVEAAAAWLKLPAHLRPMADALVALKKPVKDFQIALQKVAFNKIEKDIESIGKTYLPLLERSMTPVVVAFRNVKDSFVAFMLESQSQKDVSLVYSNTAASIQTMANALKPFLSGLRDVAAIGSTFLADQSVWAGDLSRRFQEWARVNRENGRLMQWMIEAKQGAKDLYNGLKFAVEAAYNLLTVFQTNTGADFLERFANAMEDLNKNIEQSRIHGFLANLRDFVHTMGESKMQDVKELWKAIRTGIERVLPFFKSLSDAFADIFVRALEKAIWVISKFLELLNELNITPILGWLAGIAAAITLLPKVLAVAIEAIKVFVGTSMLFVRYQKVVGGLGVAFAVATTIIGKMGPMGAKAATSLTNIGTAVSALMARLALFAGVVGAVAVAVGLMFLTISQKNKDLKEFDNALRDTAIHASTFRKTLHDAFIEDRGLVGNNVLTALKTRMEEDMADLEKLEEATPGLGTHIGDFASDIAGKFGDAFKNVFTGNLFARADPSKNLFSDSDIINQYQELGDNAKRARAEIGLLVEKEVDLTAIVRSSEPDFQRRIQQLKDEHHISQETVDVLTEQHTAYMDVKRDMEALTPAGAQLVSALEKIATAAGDADKKLDGMRQALVALGIITIDADEALAEYVTAIDELPDKVKEAIESGDGLNNVLKENGRLNILGSKTAANLAPVIKEIGDSFLLAAAKGENFDEVVAEIESAIPGLAQQLDMTEPEVRKLLESAGYAPGAIKIMAQIESHPENEQIIARMLLTLEGLRHGVNVPFTLEDKTEGEIRDIKDKLNTAFGGDIFTAEGGNIKLKPGIDPTTLTKSVADATKILADAGWDMPGAGPTPEAPTIPAPKIEPPKGPVTPPPGIFGPGTETPFTTAPQAPQAAPVPGALPAPADVKAQAEAVTKPLIDAFAQVPGSVMQSMMMANVFLTQQLEFMRNLLNEFAASGKDFGTKLVDALAEGISKNPKAFEAIEKLLEEAKKRFHKSPPKKGPLAEHGDFMRWTGGRMVQSYAGGITQEQQEVERATELIGGAAVRGIGTGEGAYEAGAFLGQLSQLSEFMQHFIETLGKIGETILNFVKFISDPLGEGTFFGKHLPWKKKQETQAQKEDRQQRALSESIENSTRNLNSFNAQVDAASGGAVGTPPGPGAEKQDIANYIIAKSLAAGLNEKEAGVVLAQAIGESGGLQAGIISPNGLWVGIFQETEDFAKRGGIDPGQRIDPGKNIDAWFNHFMKTGGEDIYDRIARTSIGGPIYPGNPAIGNFGKGSPQVAELERQAAEYLKNYTKPTGGAGGPVPPLAPGVLEDRDNLVSQAITKAGAALISQQFGNVITRMTGARASGAAGTHNAGLSIDLYPTTPEQGDEINRWLQANAKALGVASTIWRDKGLDTGVSPSRPAGGTYTVSGHQDHIDIFFASGATVNAEGLTDSIAQDINDRVGPPRVPGTPGYEPTQPQQTYQVNPQTGQMEPVPVDIDQQARPDMKIGSVQTPEGLQVTVDGIPIATIQPGTPTTSIQTKEGVEVGVVVPGATPADLPILIPPESLAPGGVPWTDETRRQFMAENPLEYTFPGQSAQDIQDIQQNQNLSSETLHDILMGIQNQDPMLKQAVETLSDVSATEQQQSDALNVIQGEADRQRRIDTPKSRYAAEGFENIISSFASEQGFEQQANPLDTAMEIMGGMTSIASDIFAVIDSAIEAAGATKDIADTLVRGVENTEDIFRLVDDIQKYIQLGADIAGATSSILGVVGSLVGAAGAGSAGGGDMGGGMAASQAIQAASQVAAMIQAVLETVNATIDLAQEAYRIIGSYVGDFLGYLVGGPGGFQGDVKFLLDKTAGELYAYGAENPQLRQEHHVPGSIPGPEFRQGVGNINVYGGPGTDPRDDTRQMIFQIKAAQMSGAMSQ